MTRLVHMTTTDMSLALLLGPQLRAFADAGYEVIGMSAAGPYVEELQRAGIEHVPLQHFTRSMAPHRDVKAFGELVRQLRRLRPDIVHTHNPKPGWFGRSAAKIAGVPLIVNTVHGLYAQPQDRRLRKAAVYSLEALAGRCSDIELVQNPEDIPVLARLGVARSKITLLGNGIDLARFDPARHDRASARAAIGVSDDEVVCGAVGRLVAEKGYPELFEAARRVMRTNPRFRLIVVGPDDPGKSDALSRAEVSRAEADGVRFLGLRHDVEGLYSAFDFYVLASHREGFPRSAMEAAAMGLPIVATDIRGCRQVVDHERTGLLVPIHNAGALAEALERLSTDGRLRAAMGAAAREKAATDFDQRRVIAITLDAYERNWAPARPRAAA
jgi:glycosyltransferase involved in cell wall biosynthesis